MIRAAKDLEIKDEKEIKARGGVTYVECTAVRCVGVLRGRLTPNTGWENHPLTQGDVRKAHWPSPLHSVANDSALLLL